MSDQNSRARVTADVVGEIALASDDADRLLLQLSRVRILGDAAIDPRVLIRESDLAAHDLSIVEIVTRSATPGLILSTLEAMKLRPAELADGFRVLLSQDRNQCQQPPYVFLIAINGTSAGRALAMSHAYDNVFTVVEISLTDDPSRPEVGWSDHCLIICRRVAGNLIEPGSFQTP